MDTPSQIIGTRGESSTVELVCSAWTRVSEEDVYDSGADTWGSGHEVICYVH